MTGSRPGVTTATWMSPTATPGPSPRSTGTDGSPSPTTDAGRRVLPGDYVRRHVELAYATTAHGVQGDTVSVAQLAVSEHTGAASAYVGMTRGRTSNIAHLVATDVADARAQWLEVFARDRADLGAAHAAELARTGSEQLRSARPLEQVLGELRGAWEREARSLERLAWHEPRRDALRDIIALESTAPVQWAAAENRYRHARVVYNQAAEQVQRSTAMIAADTDRLREHMLSLWDADRPAAHTAAQLVTRGPGPLALRLPAVNRAREELARWSVKWQPYLPDMPTDHDQIVYLRPPRRQPPGALAGFHRPRPAARRRRAPRPCRPGRDRTRRAHRPRPRP